MRDIVLGAAVLAVIIAGTVACVVAQQSTPGRVVSARPHFGEII
jgi:hypothetical protein